jgi:hypothetical protein
VAVQPDTQIVELIVASVTSGLVAPGVHDGSGNGRKRVEHVAWGCTAGAGGRGGGLDCGQREGGGTEYRDNGHAARSRSGQHRAPRDRQGDGTERLIPAVRWSAAQ